MKVGRAAPGKSRVETCGRRRQRRAAGRIKPPRCSWGKHTHRPQQLADDDSIQRLVVLQARKQAQGSRRVSDFVSTAAGRERGRKVWPLGRPAPAPCLQATASCCLRVSCSRTVHTQAAGWLQGGLAQACGGALALDRLLPPAPLRALHALLSRHALTTTRTLITRAQRAAAAFFGERPPVVGGRPMRAARCCWTPGAALLVQQ